MRRFENKNVLITGADRGIGFAVARRFGQEGANVVIASIDPKVEESANVLREEGIDAKGIVCDVTDALSVNGLFDIAEETFGQIDVSMQNAGIITIRRVQDLSESDWDATMAVNTKGVFLCCQEAIKRMRRSGKGGRLINTASGQARDGFVFTPHYAASKMGVVGLTQSLAKEVALENITVNAICPGIIQSDMWDYNDRIWGEMLGSYGPGELMAEWVETKIPMKRAGTGEQNMRA